MLDKPLAYEKWLGIKSYDQPPTLYRLLGIDAFEPDPDIISNAADSRMAFLRQFQIGENARLSELMLNEVSQARVTLLNAGRKRAYDETLRQRLPPNNPALPVASPPPFALEAPAINPSPFDVGPPSRISRRPSRSKKPDPLIWIVVPVVIAVVALIAVITGHFSGGEDLPPEHGRQTATTSSGSPNPPSTRQTAAAPSSANRPSSTATQAATVPLVTSKSAPPPVTPKSDSTAKNTAVTPKPSLKSAAIPSLPADSQAFGGHYYKFIWDHVGWVDAKKYCADLGGHLVIINNDREQDFVSNLVRNAGGCVFIGLSDEQNLGDWRWVDGSKLSFDKWADGEPNDLGGEEHWACINPSNNGRWLLTVSSANVAGFVCEWDSNAELSVAERKVAADNAAAQKDTSADTADRRLALPSNEMLAKARALIRDVYKADFDTAKTSSHKIDLATKLVQVAIDTTNDDVGRFTLLQIAKEIAVAQGDVVLAFVVIERIARSYQIDALAEKAAAITEASIPTQDNLNHVDSLLDELIHADRYETATMVLHTMQAVAQRRTDPALSKSSLARLKDVQEIATAFKGTESARATLKQDPLDRDANSLIGQFMCFYKANWDKGLLVLSEGNKDDKTQQLAVQDTTADSTDKKIKVADGWWAFAELTTEPLAKRNLKAHAVALYRSIVSDTNGLTKAKIEKRLNEASSGLTPSLTRSEPSATRAKPGPPEPREIAVVEHNSPGGTSTLPLMSDGTIEGRGDARWALNNNVVIFYWKNPAAPGGVWVDRCTLSRDRQSYKGANQNHLEITGKVLKGKL